MPLGIKPETTPQLVDFPSYPRILLTNLIFLDLASNRLSGQIPSELSDLTNLTQLDLASNRLSAGTVPTLRPN